MTESFLELSCPANEVCLNPSLLAKPEGGYLLAYRRDYLDPVYLGQPRRVTALQYWGRKTVVIEELTSDFKFTGRKLQHFEGEDPRLFHAYGKAWCSYTSCPRGWRWWLMEVNMNHHFEKLGEPFLPDYRANRYVVGGPDEKNWTWIDGTLSTFNCVYAFEPFTALRFAGRGDLVERTQRPEWSVTWKYGPIRGGSPAVLLPTGERFAVFHGFLSGGRYNRTYVAGGVYLEPEWPHRPIKVLSRPLIVGRRRLKRWPWLECECPRTRVAYPCGVVAEANRLLVSYGVDDCACAVAEFTYDELKTYDTGT